jgi:hypothetical protein
MNFLPPSGSFGALSTKTSAIFVSRFDTLAMMTTSVDLYPKRSGAL